MRPNRWMKLLLLGLLMVGSTHWAVSRTADDAVVLLRNGDMTAGELFVADDQSVSLLAKTGIVRYARSEVSQVVFLTGRNVLALRTEGRFTDDRTIEGEVFSFGGALDGLPAGTFKATLHHPTPDGLHDHLMLRTEFALERNGLPIGTLNALVVGENLPSMTSQAPLRKQLAGVILASSGEYEGRDGVVDASVVFDLAGQARGLEANYIMRF